MKKHISFILILSLLLSLMSGFNVALADNGDIVFSDSFEDGTFLKNWEYMNVASFGYVRVTDSCSTDGDKALYVWDDKSDSSIGIKSVHKEITPGLTYTVTADIYKKDGTICLYLKYYDKNKNLISEGTKSRIASGEGWKNYALSSVAPANAVYIEINIVTNIEPEGYGYYDNVKIIEGKASAKDSVDGSTPPADEDIFANDDFIQSDDVNKVYYENFENDLTGWSSFENTADLCAEISTDEKTNGNSSLHIVDNSSTQTVTLLSSAIDVTEGTVYKFSAKSKRISGSMTVNYRFYKEDGTQLNNDRVGIQANGNQWHHAVKIAAAPAEATYVVLVIAGYTNTLGEWYIDELEITEVNNSFAEHTDSSYVAPVQNETVDSEIVKPVDEKLVYNTYNENGDMLGDYSQAGFYNGQYNLPVTANLPVYEELYPSEDTSDDTERIQNAINNASKEANGEMRVVKLKAGRYKIGPRGLAMKSGVILSGEGQGPKGTVLYAYAPVQHTVITANGAKPADAGEIAYVTDSYIKAGSKTIKVSAENAADFKAGDLIAFRYPHTDKWVKAMGMSAVENFDGVLTDWYGKIQPTIERTITAVNGTELTLDFPFFIPYDQSYNDNENKTYIVKIDGAKRCRNIGIENLRIESYYDGSKEDEKHALHGISLSRVEDAFVRDVTGKYLYSSVVRCVDETKRVTVMNCSSLEPVSKIQGDRRYAFFASSNTQQILFSGCYSYGGRHDFSVSGYSAGPVAFVDNIADSSYDASETHSLWSAGVLYDNLRLIRNDTDGMISLGNRGKWGTKSSGSHGWTAVGSVVWNSLSSSILVHKPLLTYQNFAVGVYGIYNDSDSIKKRNYNINRYKSCYGVESNSYTADNFYNAEGSSLYGDSYQENQIYSVNPKSLFKAQLAERITGTIKNARPNSPTIVNPACDMQTSLTTVNFDGFCDKGAEKVTIYIDDAAYEATINPDDSTYTLSMTLNPGTHKVYATQTIDGNESGKTADRFLSVDYESADSNKLQSVYDSEKTTLLLNDTRKSYDEYLDETSIYRVNGITGEGTEKDPYIIDTAEKFSVIFGVDNTNTACYAEGIHYKITEDLTIEGHKSNSMIFRGVLFADENKTIDFGTLADNGRWLNQAQCEEMGITYDNSHRVAYSALFALANGATIKNITLAGTMTNSNAHHQGGFVAVAKATTIKNCVNNINMPGMSPGANGAVGGFIGAAKDTATTVNGCINNGVVKGKTAVGGIVGISYGTIIHCINNGDITGTKSVGGIVGDNYSNITIDNCENYGNIKSSDTWAIAAGIVACQRTYTTIVRCANYGNVTCGNGANSYAPGGIVGFITNYGSAKVTINECMNVGTITAELATAYPGAIIGDTRSTVAVTHTMNLGTVKGGSAQGRVIGSVSGLASNEGFTIASFYDANTENTFKATGTTTSATVIINNSFALSLTPDEGNVENEIKNVSSDVLRDLVSEGTFSYKIWENKANNGYPYPTLINNPYIMALPDNLAPAHGILTSDSGEVFVKDGKCYDTYLLAVSKAPAVTGVTLKEFGVITGRQEDITIENCGGKFKGDYDKRMPISGAFGCLLLYSPSTQGVKTITKAFVRPYAIYEDIAGGEHIIYGAATGFDL